MLFIVSLRHFSSPADYFLFPLTFKSSSRRWDCEEEEHFSFAKRKQKKHWVKHRERRIKLCNRIKQFHYVTNCIYCMSKALWCLDFYLRFLTSFARAQSKVLSLTGEWNCLPFAFLLQCLKHVNPKSRFNIEDSLIAIHCCIFRLYCSSRA